MVHKTKGGSTLVMAIFLSVRRPPYRALTFARVVYREMVKRFKRLTPLSPLQAQTHVRNNTFLSEFWSASVTPASQAFVQTAHANH